MQVELPGSVPQSCEVICVPGDPRDLEWVTEKLKRGFSVDWDNAYATYQRCGILVNLCLFASPKTFGILPFGYLTLHGAHLTGGLAEAVRNFVVSLIFGGW